MNIAVISPHYSNNGNTTVASLIAMELSTRGKKVCLTHTSTKSPSIMRYFGLDDVEQDKTANPSRLVKMLQEQLLKQEEISDYCRCITPLVEVFSANDSKFKHEDMMYALKYITTSFPHEYIVFDVDDKDLDSEANRLVIGKSDFVIIVLTQSIMECRAFKRNIKSIEKVLGNKPMCVVVNHYNSIIGKPADVAYEIGSKSIKKKSSWLYIRENPYIVKYSNKGAIQELHREMKSEDFRVIDIYNDVRNIVNRIMKFKQATRGNMKQTKDGGRVAQTKETTDNKKETTEVKKDDIRKEVWQNEDRDNQT